MQPADLNLRGNLGAFSLLRTCNFMHLHLQESQRVAYYLWYLLYLSDFTAQGCKSLGHYSWP